MKKLFLFFFFTPVLIQAQQEKPNIILIMADDMGWSDIGCYGGEIPTPNIDLLAKNGIRFKQFYNNARCCPTRASLLTGLYAHQTGIGQMTESPEKPLNADWKTPGYRGFLNKNSVTIAEVLKTNGYKTYMAGKWHLGFHNQDRWPKQRGFDEFYGIISGASSYLLPEGERSVFRNNTRLTTAPNSGFYSTDAFTDQALNFIDEHPKDDSFFLYVAYTAPHWPLHAKDADIAKFKDHFDEGWDKLREKRFERQIEMGLVDENWNISSRDERVRPWVELSQEEKDSVSYRMEVYAAQVYAMDYNIGRLINQLKKNGQFENTLIMFLSDNGACAEFYDELGSKPHSYINDPRYSAVSYGIGWANMSNTPFFEYKVKPYEGGMATPFIAHMPSRYQGGSITNSIGTIRDIMPTILELSGTIYPQTFHDDKDIFTLEGKSLVPILSNVEEDDHEVLYWEHQNYGAARKGKWKIIKDFNKDSPWELYNVEIDRTEKNNLAESHKELVNQLVSKYFIWANSHFVYPKKNSK